MLSISIIKVMDMSSKIEAACAAIQSSAAAADSTFQLLALSERPLRRDIDDLSQ